MMKFIFLAIVIYTIYKLFKKSSHRPVNNVTNEYEKIGTAEMVSCAKCGTFVLKTEAVFKSGSVYCSNNCSMTIN